MAELVDAHASGACDPRSWKFESSSGHQKISLRRDFFMLWTRRLAHVSAKLEKDYALGNVSSLRGAYALSSLTNVFQDFADKNNRSNGCFYLAILQGTKKISLRRDFFMLWTRRCFIIKVGAKAKYIKTPPTILVGGAWYTELNKVKLMKYD